MSETVMLCDARRYLVRQLDKISSNMAMQAIPAWRKLIARDYDVVNAAINAIDELAATKLQLATALETTEAVQAVEEWEGPRNGRTYWIEAPRGPQQQLWRAWAWSDRATANPRVVATADSLAALGRTLRKQKEGE